MSIVPTMVHYNCPEPLPEGGTPPEFVEMGAQGGGPTGSEVYQCPVCQQIVGVDLSTGRLILYI
jgi:hypothetical protein